MSTAYGLSFNKAWVSNERFASFLDAAGQNEALAEELYVWNARVSAALFEVIHHLEVLTRNAIIEQLETVPLNSVEVPGTPWVQQASLVDEASRRIRNRKKTVTVHRIAAQVTFGFWAKMFETEFESLWRSRLRFAFKHSPGDRKSVLAVMQAVQNVRNLVAHHGSLLELDPSIEFEKMAKLAGWIDPSAEVWIRLLERVNEVVALRPIIPPKNVLIVASESAWEIYEKTGAYVSPANRTFRKVEYIGFYSEREIKPKLAKIVSQEPLVTFSKSESKRLKGIQEEGATMMSQVIGTALASGIAPDTYQVFILSSSKSADTVDIDAIPHTRVGRGSAFVRRHRYFSLGALTSAEHTGHL